MKRVVTIQDISCIGKCSITVALPIISAAGIETAILPTAVLSTHTAFENFTFLDLTDEIQPIADCWAKEGFEFDAIYTGYLGSIRQIGVVSDFIDRFKTEDNVVFIDPAMADNGSLYKGFDKAYVKEMAKLCAKADVIVPNITEAAFMLDEEYIAEGYSEDYVKKLLVKLCGFGCKKAILTGVSFDSKKLGIMMYDSEKKEFYSYFSEKIPYMSHGTGDVFASACIGAVVRGCDVHTAAAIAADYTAECIRLNYNDKNSSWYGVDFETKIPYLIQRLEKECGDYKQGVSI